MVKQIRVIGRNNLQVFEDEVNDFLKAFPEAQILAIHPKQMDAKGLIAVISYTGELKPYKAIVAELDQTTLKSDKLETSLNESLKMVENYQLDSKKDKKALIQAKAEIEDLRNALKAASEPLEDKLDDYDFDPIKLKATHQDWINAYEEETGRKAIHRGETTKGFKQYIRSEYLS